MKNLILLFSIVALSLISHAASAQDASPVAVKFFIGNEQADVTNGIATTQLSQLKVKVVGDSAKDVKYTMRWKLYLRTGANTGIPQNGTTESLMPGVLSSARVGDIVTV